MNYSGFSPEDDAASRLESARFNGFVRFLTTSNTPETMVGMTLREVFSSPEYVLGALSRRDEHINGLVASVRENIASWGDTALDGPITHEVVHTMLEWAVVNAQLFNELMERVTEEIARVEKGNLTRALQRGEYLDEFFGFLSEKIDSQLPWKAIFKHRFVSKIDELLSMVEPQALRNDVPFVRQARMVQEAYRLLNERGDNTFFPDWQEGDFLWTNNFLLAINAGMDRARKDMILKKVAEENVELFLHQEVGELDWEKLELDDEAVRFAQGLGKDEDVYGLGLENWRSGESDEADDDAA